MILAGEGGGKRIFLNKFLQYPEEQKISGYTLYFLFIWDKVPRLNV